MADVLLSHHACRIPEDAPAVLRKHQCLACALEGVSRIMRVEYAGDTLCGQSSHRVEHDELVLEVEVGFRLVEYQYLRFCRHCTGYEHHLQLAAAYRITRLVCKMRYAQPFHYLLRDLHVLSRRGGKSSYAAAPSEQHGLECRVRHRGRPRLRHVCHPAPEPGRRYVTYVFAVEKAASALPVQHVHHASQQGRLARSVWSEHREYLARFHNYIYVLKYLRSALVCEAAVFYPE